MTALSLQIETCQFLPQAKKKMQFFARLQLVPEALAEVARRPRECPMGLDDQLVEDCVGLKNGAETRLYEPNDSRLP